MEKKMRELLSLYRDRLKDRAQAKTRRRRRVEATPEPVSALVNTYFQKDPQALRRIEEQRALAAWAELVGPTAAAVSRAERIRGGQLVIRVRDPLWMHQLYLLKHELLKKYQTAFPSLGLDDIYYTGGL